MADVDGTLLGTTRHASDNVVAALARAERAGLRVGVATGRMTAAVEPLLQRTALRGPHIVHNGAQVRTNGTVVESWPLSAQQVRSLIDVCARQRIYAELYVGDGFLVTDRRDEARPHWELMHQEPAGSAQDLRPGRDEVVKATVVVFEQAPDEVLDFLARAGLHAGVATSPLAPGMTFLNVTDRDADKGRALRAAAAHLGLGLSEIAAVGDGDNDVSMLAIAGTAIAMGQAPPPVMDAAHLRVPEVRVEGVVHALDALAAWARDASRRPESTQGKRR